MSGDKQAHDARMLRCKAMMSRLELDALVIAGAGDHGKRGYFQYLVGHAIWDREGYWVLLPDGREIVVLMTVSQAFWARQHAADVRVSHVPGIELRDLLNEAGTNIRRLGIVGYLNVMPIRDGEEIRKLRVFDIQDVTEEFVKSVMSQKDLNEVGSLERASAKMDSAYLTAMAYMGDGVSECEINGRAQGSLFAGGAIDTLPLMMHVPGEPYLAAPRERAIQMGEIGCVSLEAASADGYWIELARMFGLGALAESDQRLVNAVHDVHQRVLDAIMPGSRAGAIAELAQREAARWHYDMGIWLGHGIGLTLPEWPSLVIGDDSEITEGMVLALHPHLIDRDRQAGAYVADTVVVEKSGARRLSTLPLMLTEVSVEAAARAE